MKNILFLLTFFFIISASRAQDTAALQAIRHFQEELNRQYRTVGESPLPENERATFKEHPFFAVDLAFRFEATLIRTPQAKEFKMKTSGEKVKDYRKYGELHFVYKGKPYKLSAYQSLDLIKKDEYKDYLFVPFTDLTTGETTYGGGRYIDLRIPEKDKVILDFNQSYHPYCAYATGYNCPIPPKENFLNLKVEAGIKYAGEH